MDSAHIPEKPQNGIKGLKHWRYDLLAGVQVALVSLPLSLGIAIASGAPPVTGVISAIIAGLIFPFLGGAYVTISGPAAGLAPALLAGMITLGGGDLAAGYPLLLVAICLTGLLQIVLSLFKAGALRVVPAGDGGRGDARGNRHHDYRQADPGAAGRFCAAREEHAGDDCESAR